MDRALLKTIVLEQQNIPQPQQMVGRQLPISLDVLIETQNIVIITGIRRCGKSTQLQFLRQQHQDNHYYLNFDDERLINFAVEHFQLLMEVFVELYGEERVCYFDEIQNIVGWERFVRRLFDQGYKIFLTGSNANMLSQELGTHLTGRHIKLELYPFSFNEFCAYKEFQFDLKQITTTSKARLIRETESYIKIGGFPQHIKEQLVEYLQSLYENILYRDIVTRYKLPTDRVIKQLAFYFASNIGKEITYNSLRKLLQLGSANTVSDYCQFFENCYLFFLVKRYSRSLKSQSASPKKVYAIDTGMAHAIGFRQSADSGRMLENIVFIELRRRNFDVYYHRDSKECDFVVCRQNQITALIQVCYDVSDKETRDREINGLVDAMQAYRFSQGLIVTLANHDDLEVSVDGVQCKINVMPIWDWLSSSDL